MSKNIASLLSKSISYLLHPFFIPTYVVIMLMVINTSLLPVSSQSQWFVMQVIVVNTLLIPALFIGLLKVFGRIDNFSLESRKERITPLFIVIICYLCCGWIFSDLPALFIVKKVVFAAAGSIFFGFTVNFFWKISLHLMGIGGILGVIWVLIYVGYVELLLPFCIIVVLAGLLASSRLYLGKHTPWQVTIGFFASFVISGTLLILT